MANYRKGPLVNSDMRAIGRYTQKQWGSAQRRTYLTQLVERYIDLAEHPHSGKACDYIRAGYRKYPQGKHVIFYRVADDGVIEIVRVLHERMDYKQHIT